MLEQIISKDMTIGDIVRKYPQTMEVLNKYGIQCVGCHVNMEETLEQGILAHGMGEGALITMLEDMNLAVKANGFQMAQTDQKPVMVSEKAARKLIEIGEKSGLAGQAVRVEVTPGGCAGFTYGMNFTQEKRAEDLVMDMHGVKVFVDPRSAETLSGTVIDYVESLQGSGFKFVNPKEKHSCGCGKSFS